MRVVWSMRHTVRYGGIEPPPVSHERQAAFVSMYRIEQSAKRKREKCMQSQKEEMIMEVRFGDCVEAALRCARFRLY